MTGKTPSLKILWKLLRVPNLLMMALTLLLTRYAVFEPLYTEAGIPLQMPAPDFMLLIFSTLLIAAGGYIVNDIFDTNIDEQNKAGQIIVGKQISEKSAWNLYYILNFTGILAGTYISWHAGHIQLGILFLIIATMLFYYSLKYKYLPFWGNFVISVLSAFVILIYYLLEFFNLRGNPYAFTDLIPYFPEINVRVFAYTFFAFITTFIREITKDTQDIEGDRKSGCRTFPIIFGIEKVKWIIIVLILFSIIALAFMQYFAFSSNFFWIAFYLLIVQFLFIYTAWTISKSQESGDFAFASKLLKLTMTAGILSMVFSGIYS